ncbi:trypsin-like serine protease [Kordia sp.]|uniref:trypsin-like serine protease n=1 Tax=Kordia sp. TaxID=1965332 RepID=UPI003B5AE130
MNSLKFTNAIILLLLISLTLVSFSYMNNKKHNPILTRHDKDDAEFIKLAEKFEKYMCHLNLPDCEGTIIGDQWAISAAHCAVGIVEKFDAGRKHFVIINGEEIEVDKVIMYKEWDNIQEKLAMLNDMSSLNDIALLHLKNKPLNSMQAKLYVDEDEIDKLVYMLGKGDIGNGLIGVNSNDGKQRGATNRIETATDKWLTWTFDHPDTKTKYLTEYEGISGPGDSGGPAFIVKDDTVYLAGISSWQDTKDGPEGLYGVVENYTRVSQYIKWINEEMAETNTASEEILRVVQKPNAIDDRPKAIDVDPSTLKLYVGEYEIQENIIKIYTKEKGTKLYLSVAGQPAYELVPTAEHKFSFKISGEYRIEFKKTANGIFNELITIQPDGTYKATRK